MEMPDALTKYLPMYIGCIQKVCYAHMPDVPTKHLHMYIGYWFYIEGFLCGDA